jgi:argininosuccinate lyase
LTVAKGLPLAYNKDFQEDKEALFDTVDTVLNTLAVLPPMLRTAHWRTDRLGEAAVADFSLATDAADLLARRGVPFREAHETVGKLVALCLRDGKTFADLSDAEWAESHPIFIQERPPLTAHESVRARDVPGGTAPQQVARQTKAAQEAIAAARQTINERKNEREAMMTQPGQVGA